jgi:hypothetical protein
MMVVPDVVPGPLHARLQPVLEPFHPPDLSHLRIGVCGQDFPQGFAQTDSKVIVNEQKNSLHAQKSLNDYF